MASAPFVTFAISMAQFLLWIGPIISSTVYINNGDTGDIAVEFSHAFFTSTPSRVTGTHSRSFPCKSSHITKCVDGNRDVAFVSADACATRKFQHITESMACANDREEGEQSKSFSWNRRYIASTAVSTMTASLFPIHRRVAMADEPSNLYYKSRSDEEDPLIVFGRSLQNMNVDRDAFTPSTKGEGTDEVPSFMDLTLPSSSTLPNSAAIPSSGMTLDVAIQKKSESQKRRIDPRTHG